MNLHVARALRVRQIVGVVAALALGNFGLPALAAGGIAHLSHAGRAPATLEITGTSTAVVSDSQWVVHSGDAGGLALGRGDITAHGFDTFTGGALGESGGAVDYSGAFRRRNSGYWPEHGGLEGGGLDEGRFDDDKFCDGRCVPNPGVVPEPGSTILALTGVALLFLLVRRRRPRGG